MQMKIARGKVLSVVLVLVTMLSAATPAFAAVPSGTYQNTATAEAANASRVQAQADVSIAQPHLEVAKVADREVVNSGDTVIYTTTIEQAIPDAVAYNVVISDALDSASQAAGIKIDMASIKVLDPSGADITNSCTVIPTLSNTAFSIKTSCGLAGGKTLTVMYDVTVPTGANLKGHAITNHA